MATGPEQAVLRHGSLYRRLLWLYPASFREEYREAMVQLFCDQLRNQTGDRLRSRGRAPLDPAQAGWGQRRVEARPRAPR